MFCRNCQTIIPDDSIFCENCGAPTGLNPDEIEVKNLVPEDAVEFEVSEDAPQVTSVPVDPVWWEPPEEPAAESSWDGWGDPEETEEAEDIEEEPPREDAPAGEETETEPEEEAPETAAERETPDLKHLAEETMEQAKPYLEKAKSMLGDLGKNVRTGTGWVAEKVKEQLQHREEEEAEEPAEPEEAFYRDEPAEPEIDEPVIAEEPSDEEDAIRTEPVIEPYLPEEDGGDEEAEAEAEEPAEPEIDEPVRSEEPDELPGSEPEELKSSTEDLKESLEDVADHAKVYLDKARSVLEDLGKNVRTGTGRAAEAARQQFQQRKEEYEEKKEEREKQRAEERQREEEQRQKDEEARRLAEQERQEELERQREKDQREREEDMIQRPGFWYGQVTEEPEDPQEPEPAEDLKETEAAEEPQETEEIEKAEETGEEAQAEAETGETEAGPESEETEEAEEAGEAEAEIEPEASEPAEAEAETEPEPEEPGETEEAEEAAPEEAQEPEPDPLPEQEIEDKLADTARFSWSEEELKEAAERGVEPEMPDAPEGDAPEEGASGSTEETAEEAASETEEPSPYRIKDYEPYEGVQKKQPFFTKDKTKLIIVIAAIAVVVAIIAGVMIHQAHQRQLEEQAYAASVKKAEQLVDAKKYDKAEAQYLKLMEQRPEDTQLYVALAQMYVDQQRYIDAKALIKRAIKITGDKEAFQQLRKDIKVLTSTKWKKEYIRVLEDNEDDIHSYEDRVQASVAVCDVNGDMKPELFFFTREYYGYGKLHIYTTVNNKAKEVFYECKNHRTSYEDAFYDVSSSDLSYAIFNSKEEGKFSIYCNATTGGDSMDITNEYTLNLNGGCKREKLLEGDIDTTYSEAENDDSEYKLNDEEISYDEYIGEFKNMLNEAKQVILYNGDDSSGGDQTVWEKVNPDTVMCMSYDDLMVDLRAK